jgi:putative ABC transport system ATP-binding protein
MKTVEIPNATSKPPDFGKSPEHDPLFRARGLTKIYPSGDVEVRALDGIDLDLFEGELVVLLGASGSGKSTLLNILGGLDVATAGALTYRGEDLTGADEKALTQYRRNSVGFIFQFYNLIPSLTARENVALITEISRDPMLPEEALALVGLRDRMDHFPSQMSGGEQQRVAISRAIAKRPEVLLCDEPISFSSAPDGFPNPAATMKWWSERHSPLLTPSIQAIPLNVQEGIRPEFDTIVTESVRLPLVLTPQTYATAALIVFLSSGVSFAVVSRRIRNLDLIGVLKARE